MTGEAVGTQVLVMMNLILVAFTTNILLPSPVVAPILPHSTEVAKASDLATLYYIRMGWLTNT